MQATTLFPPPLRIPDLVYRELLFYGSFSYIGIVS